VLRIFSPCDLRSRNEAVDGELPPSSTACCDADVAYQVGQSRV
jgi:hypothetical protein